MQELLSKFFAKLFGDLLPAAAASAFGALLISHLAQAPITPETKGGAATAEMVQMVRDEHALVLETLRVDTNNRRQLAQSADEDAARLRTAALEQAVTEREARLAE